MDLIILAIMALVTLLWWASATRWRTAVAVRGRPEWVGFGSSEEQSVEHCDRHRGFQWNRMGDQTIAHAPHRKPAKASACVAES